MWLINVPASKSNACLLHGGRIIHFVAFKYRRHFNFQRRSDRQFFLFLQHIVIFDAVFDAKVPQFWCFVFLRDLRHGTQLNTNLPYLFKSLILTSNNKVKFSMSMYFFKYRSQRLFKCSSMYRSASLSRSNVSCREEVRSGGS